MTYGEIQEKRLEVVLRRITIFAIPIALLASIGSYLLIVESLMFAVIVFILLILTAVDEYWYRLRILNSPEKLEELKNIEDKRKAAMYVNGGFLRELKQLIVILLIIGAWFYIS